MSLKAFHVVFIAASMMLCFGLSAWAFGNYRADGQSTDLMYSVGALMASAALVVYGRFFLRKLKNISYL